jgi:hypothetical protein
VIRETEEDSGFKRTGNDMVRSHGRGGTADSNAMAVQRFEVICRRRRKQEDGVTRPNSNDNALVRSRLEEDDAVGEREEDDEG